MYLNVCIGFWENRFPRRKTQLLDSRWFSQKQPTRSFIGHNPWENFWPVSKNLGTHNARKMLVVAKLSRKTAFFSIPFAIS